MNSSSFVTRRPVAVLMVVLAAVVFGLFSYRQLPVTLMPELSYPTLTVRTEYPGAAPEEVENDISRPVEDALGVIGGLSKISSVSRAGVSDVVLEFGWDSDMSEALQDTLEKLDLVFLPTAAERPLILRFDPSLDPVLELSLSASDAHFEGDVGLRRLRRIAELQVRRALEPVPGVAAVRLRGGLEEEIQVLVDDESLRRSGLPIDRLVERLAQENVNVAGGTIREGRTEYMVRTLNEFQNLTQIGATMIALDHGREIRVRDVARVENGHRERQILTRTDGAESVQVDIYKEADANMVALSKAIRARLGDLESEPKKAAKRQPLGADKQPQGSRVPGAGEGLAAELLRTEGARLEVVADRSLFIESSINEVKSTALFGGLLAVLVLLLFLRSLKSTVIVALAIPISLVVTFAPLKLLGVSLNIMSLGGLALGVGMLVDSSIVVLESIFRCREEGDGVVAAAVRGTREVQGAVVASILTSIAVFFPMVFVEGVAGQAFGDLGLAVVIALLASLVVALAFIPMLASRQGLDRGGARQRRISWRFGAWQQLRRDLRALRAWRRRGGLPRALAPLAVVPYLLFRGLLQALLEGVGKLILLALFASLGLLAVALRLAEPVLLRPGRALAAVAERLLLAGEHFYSRLLRRILALPLTVLVLALLLLGMTAWLATRLDSELLPEVHQGELTVEVALPVGTPLEQTDAVLRPVEQAILAEEEAIRSLLLTVGFDPANSQRSDEGEHTARFKVLLQSADPRLEDRVVASLRRRFLAIPDLEARVVRPVLFSFRTPIEVEVHGDDLGELRRWSERVREQLTALPELADVESTLRAGAPEVQIIYDRDQLARYDLNIARVAEQVKNAVQGTEATRFNLRDRRIPIVVRLDQEDRASVDDVRQLVVNPGGERPISLDAVAAVILGEGPSEVRRVDGRRVALVRASLAGGALGGAVVAIDGKLRQLDWPARMTYLLSGQSEEWQNSRSSLLLALALSIFLVYVIMAAQFESLLQPLVIMLSIPLAFLGTVLALYGLGISLSIVAFLGMIMLAGIVVNNAIVLVDYINTLRRRGLALERAVLEAGRVRLRPILMTTATTALGLAPMAAGLGDGAEIRRPMAIAVISGLVVSTLLTLVVIPSFYTSIGRLQARWLGPGALEPTTAPAADPARRKLDATSN